MTKDLLTIIQDELVTLENSYRVCGVINLDGMVYPLGSDTKVLSTIFELLTRPAIYRIAEKIGCQVVEPTVQNHYPDFTLMKSESDKQKIAIDVKTTYRKGNSKFNFTLGGYTSFIREGNEKKNIVYPFSDYAEHYVIGFVYERIAEKKSAINKTYNVKELSSIPLPFKDVQVFVNHKWRIASDKAGSGNTTNIGSISGTLEDFTAGRGVFSSEDEFLDYWRGYGRTKADRSSVYSTVDEFRSRKNNKSGES